MQQYLKIVGNGQRTARDLTADEAETAFSLIMERKASLSQVAAFMAALRIKEESAEELAIFTRVLRRYCQRKQLSIPYLVDICLPYDGRSKHFSLIPAAALIAASAGARVVLHGRCGQSTPPKFGLGVGDILTVLDIAVNLPLDTAGTLLLDDSVGVSYVDVTQFAPALEYFNAVRFDYGMRSFFDTIEKLINPFNAPNALMGVFHGPVLERVAAAMQQQGYQRAMAVQGTEGAIDVMTNRRTPLIEFVGDGGLQSWSIDPAKYGGWSNDTEANPSITLQANADLTRQLLAPYAPIPRLESFRRSALLTAAIMIYVSGKTTTYGEALESAEAALMNGDAAARLSRWQTQSTHLMDHKTEVNYVG
jgi:anthranilate phosphoribosyltransferase